MKALLLWYPKNPHELDLDRNYGYTSQDAIESGEFSDEEKKRISDVLDTLKSVPELLTY